MRFILDLIIGIYEAVLEKIEAGDCNLMARRHNLTDAEKIGIARRLAKRLAFFELA